MNFNQNKYCALMIFLLTLLVLPLNKVYSQEKQALLENELLQQFNNTYDFNNEGNNSVTLPDNYFAENAEFINDKRSEYESQEHQNYLQIYMDGNENEVTATQNGVGNLMDIGVDGNDNTGMYSQQGNRNFIYDRFDGDGIDHEINQTGNDLGIYNEGMQALPMIIDQQGQGMKLKITGPPN